jgi:F-type H+-transporting ATPase subunit b
MIPNITLVIQGLAFFAVVLLVMKFIWPPIIAAIEERQAKIAEGLSQAEKARKELADADARVAEEIKKARAEATTIIDKAHQQATQIVDKARRGAGAQGARGTARQGRCARSGRCREDPQPRNRCQCPQGADRPAGHRDLTCPTH